MLKLYGIANCDTVKKARAWLNQHNIVYEFHDFKKHGVTESMLLNWLKQLGWQKLLKKTGTTWSRELSPEDQAGVKDEASTLKIMLKYHNIIKRPLLEKDGQILAAGFNVAEYENLKL
ncbi:MAG: Spx/MgsR family RNA polymerase-binding regulatory protein [Gallionellaceae bacterium]|jgi:Spx/MgsR family transcriptional regulator